MQQLNPTEISEIIKQRIERLDISTQARNEGTIVSVSDGIVRIHGLAEVMYGEMIEFQGGVYGMALNLERDSVGAVVLGEYKALAEGQTCRCTGRVLEVPIGPALEGRVVDALGNPIDGKGPINATLFEPIEKVAHVVILEFMVAINDVHAGVLVGIGITLRVARTVHVLSHYGTIDLGLAALAFFLFAGGKEQ